MFESQPDLSDVHEQLKEVTSDNTKLKQEIFELRQMISDIGNKKLEKLKKQK